MDRRSAHVRSQIQKLARRRGRTGIRYPAALHAEAVRLARERLAQGVALARIARDLGLRPPTLSLWLRKTPKPSLRRVALAPDPQPTPATGPATVPVLVTPRGFRVEGLDVDTLALLLRAFA